MMDPERHEGTVGRDQRRHPATYHGYGSGGGPEWTTAARAASPQSEPTRARRACERLLLLAEAEGAVSEGGVPGA